MRRLTLQTVLVLTGVAALIAPPAAMAGPLGDCNSNGKLTGHYSRSELQAALSSMPVTIKEYTNCYDVISRALAATATAGGGGGSSSGTPGAATTTGTTTAAATTHKGKAKAAKKHKKKKTAAATTTTDTTAAPPGTSTGHPAANTGSGVPTPLIVVLILLGLGALGGAGVALRRHVAARDST